MEETFVLGLRLQLAALCCAEKELGVGCMFHSGRIPVDGLVSRWAPVCGEKSRKKRNGPACGVQGQQPSFPGSLEGGGWPGAVSAWCRVVLVLHLFDLSLEQT